MNVAIIPARGGSKRIKKKNIKEFDGKPIIWYSIENAKKTGLFEKIIVSTDSEEISSLVREKEVEVPFLRPKELSGDYVGITDVVAHSVNWLINENITLDSICCISATAPLLLKEEIIKAHFLFKSGTWDYVFAAAAYNTPIQRSFKKLKEGGVEMYWPKNFLKRSQDCEKTYYDVGQFYWGKPSAWLSKKKIFSKKSTFIELNVTRAIDIDTLQDWERALYYKKYLEAQRIKE